MTTCRTGSRDVSREVAIDGERCVHALLATASCRACIEACPRQALRLGEEALGIDTTACDGCGLCRPACPEAAIAVGAPIHRRRTRDGLIAFAICEWAGQAAGAGVVACLHAVGRRELEGLAGEGVVRLTVAHGDCDRCPRRPEATLAEAASDARRIQRSRGEKPIEIDWQSPSRWRETLAASGRAEAPVDTARRGFLGLGRRAPSRALRPAASGPPDAGHLSARSPVLSPGACTGCDACVRICPHGALRLGKAGDDLRYETVPESCTGCGLCMDVCAHDAIRVELMSGVRQVLALRSGRCRACGAPYHEPPARPSSDLCPICSRHNHRSALFQVNDPGRRNT